VNQEEFQSIYLARMRRNLRTTHTAAESNIPVRCLGRTEADREITNEPWSSMQSREKRKKTKEKTSFR